MALQSMVRKTMAVVIAFLFMLPPGLHAAPSQALGYEPKYKPDFSHFEYVNPSAPKGGHFVLSAPGSFDSLNPFILRGISAAYIDSLMFETLMTGSLDEPFSQYGLLAEDAELSKDGLSVTYRLNPAARFSDGSRVTADDVKFSFDTLKSDKAHPRFRIYWADITKAVIVDDLTVRFEFARENPELHMIVGQFPVFSRKWIGERSFDEMALNMPLASGPYVVERYDLGKNITYVRNPDYWAKDLNSRRGQFNFDRITVKYYRDTTVALEAFKAGEFDFMEVYNSKQWARDYVGEKFDKGILVKQELEHSNNAGLQGFVFNLRRPFFQDQRVRKAISLALDFEWANRNLFYGQYERCDSYFSNSELASRGLPQGDELKLLEEFRDRLPPEIFDKEWRPGTTEPPHSLRDNLRQAKRLLEDAGWRYRNGALRDAKGMPLAFEITLVSAQKGFERIVAPFARNLSKLGIKVSYRSVDPAIYQRKVETFNFDMVVETFGQSQSPGNELFDVFHSSSADREASQNVIGLKNPVVDDLINKVVFAPDRAGLVTAARALDRVLLHGDYVVPNWYINVHRVAYKNGLGMPDTLPLYYSATSWVLSSWWAGTPVVTD